MLYRGERLGSGGLPRCDIAVDPLDGTSLTAAGRDGAVAVVAMANEGCMFDPGPAFYMEKLAVGPEAAHCIDITAPVETNLARIAAALGKPVDELAVVVLDRPRHEALIARIRAVGSRIHLISDGDVAAAIATARPNSKVDVLLGIGGTPEGVIAAAALRCLGGAIQGRLWPRHDADRAAFAAAGLDPTRVLTTEDLCSGDEARGGPRRRPPRRGRDAAPPARLAQVFFAATGVSDGNLLDGVRFTAGGAVTNSIVMRFRSGTIRELHTEHRWRAAPATLNPYCTHMDAGSAAR